MNNTNTRGYYQKLPSYPNGVGINETLIQYSNGENWVHSAMIREVKSNGRIYVAEHTGEEGNTAYGLDGTSLANTRVNTRTFWVNN